MFFTWAVVVGFLSGWLRSYVKLLFSKLADIVSGIVVYDCIRLIN